MTNSVISNADNDTASVIAREAIALADELDQIRSIYGEGCLASVKRALTTDPHSDWFDTISKAISDWSEAQPRIDLDAIF